MAKLIDLTGQRFGRLVVISRAENGPKGYARWNCKCDCGGSTTTTSSKLNNGHTQSCGCFQRDQARKSATTHGEAVGNNTAEYRAWAHMHHRCYNKSDKRYNRYGGRGITVCERWKDYSAFLSDMGRRPSNDYSIERIDNDGNYCPENCIWADKKAQANNRRSNRFITYNNEELTLAEASEKYGISYAALTQRIGKLNWPVDKAIEIPVRPKKPQGR